ncbi:MAG: sensor histidine kinase [Rhodanobacteraceae bacterium]|nr:sensor histidine kinase [Pseudomonadota bacterium]
MSNQPIETLRKLFVPAADSLMCKQGRRGKPRWFMVCNLLWLMWVLGDMLYGQHLDRWFVPVTGVTVALFLLLYGLAYLRPMRELLAYSLAIGLLGCLSMPVNHSGGGAYIIYACAFFAFQGTPRRAIAMIVGLSLIFMLEAFALHWPWQIVLMMTLICFAVGGGNIAYWVNSQKDAELRLSHDEVRRLAATAERERIGRDLHDLLGHTLSLITLKLELSRKLFDHDLEAARREIIEAESVARHALSEVRSAVTGIRATDLAAEFASARLLLESSGVRLDYQLSSLELPAEVERDLALVVREAATNIARHARASVACIELARAGDHVVMRVADNGRGGIGADGNGLTGMRERVRALGGDLKIESPLRCGTALCVRIPMPTRITAKLETTEIGPALSSSRIAPALAGGSCT